MIARIEPQGGSREQRGRMEAAEARLQRLRGDIEQRCRAGADTSEAWQLFTLTASDMGSMRQSERLLKALHRARQGDWATVQTALLGASGARRTVIDPGAVIHTPAIRSLDCHLIESGLASLRFGNAEGIEVGMVGVGGIIGPSALLAPQPVPVAAVATTRCHLVSMPLEMLGSQLLSSDGGLAFLHASIAKQWADAAMLARCNAAHSVEKRVARWTLTAHHHVGTHIRPISHERLAALLGVRRASVTVALHELESEGAIRSVRNAIEVRDEVALERLSCECSALLAGPPKPSSPRTAQPSRLAYVSLTHG